MVLYNRFINPLRKIVCLSRLCFCDDFKWNSVFWSMFRQKTGSFKFYPSEKEIQLKLISKDELGGRCPKEPKPRAMRDRDLWVATTQAPWHCLPVEPRIPLGSEGSKTDQEAQATRSNANIMDWPQLKSCKTQWFLRNPRAPLKITSERLLASIISSLTQ